MAMYLQLRVGPVHLLLDALKVHEVMALDGLARGAQSHVQWRDEVLQCLELGPFLQVQAEPATMAVVYSPADEGLPLVLGVCEVLGLRALQPKDWSAMPRLPAASAAFFDAVWLEPQHQRQSFRLRYPLAALALEPGEGGAVDPALVEDLGQD